MNVYLNKITDKPRSTTSVALTVSRIIIIYYLCFVKNIVSFLSSTS